MSGGRADWFPLDCLDSVGYSIRLEEGEVVVLLGKEGGQQQRQWCVTRLLPRLLAWAQAGEVRQATVWRRGREDITTQASYFH